ncbi:methyl-accepting chemotaxis protein [Marinobacterium lutimaris]|uniref:Methyl-accepting chemotaxis protein n=1 Tax=Marinobacterium lutimaris TaxID=568106 RepID=A0A1H5YYI4_9GAMM|nr:methyl-accepting chemotaxis protein [Marinobacterium lutimaris]SEG28517.1 methyl-accepting chemotaxis protein [Marinobacterium lutimaris]
MGITKLLENISIGKKLLIGFGTILLLTLIVALAGGRGLSMAKDSSEKVSLAEDINVALMDAKSSRQRYLRTGAEADYEVLSENIERMVAKLNQLKARDLDAGETRALDELGRTLSSYQGQLNKILSLKSERVDTRKEWASYGSALLGLLGEISDEANRIALQRDDWRAAALAEKAYHRYTMARYQVRGYLITLAAADNRTENGSRALDGTIEKIVAEFNDLADTLRQSQIGISRNTLNEAASNLNQYGEYLMRVHQIDNRLGDAQLALVGSAIALSKEVAQMLDDQAEAQRVDARQSNLILTVVTALAIVLGLLLAMLIARVIGRPLADAANAAHRIAEGDLTQTIDSNRKDEIGALMGAMAQMNSRLRELLSRINQGVSELTSASSQINSSAEKNQQGMELQRAETDQVAAAINEMTMAVQEVARSAEDASGAADDADNQAKEGVKGISGTVETINRMASEISATANAMGELKAQSDDIGRVIDVIKGIAEQTNLLALNAAIEAARAGDAGRGFAVVADEVRGLAQRTQESTTEIEELIGSLQQNAERSLAMMESGQQMTDESVSSTHTTGSLLDNIANAVSLIQQMNQQIATAAEEQGSVAEEINQSVVRVRDITETSATSSSETVAATRMLVDVSRNLQGLVKEFKV